MQMNPTEAYEQERELMTKHGFSVRPETLRAHLDFQRGISRISPGLHPTVITITATATAEQVGLFSEVPVMPVVRVAGQNYEANDI